MLFWLTILAVLYIAISLLVPSAPVKEDVKKKKNEKPKPQSSIWEWYSFFDDNV